MSLLIFWLTLNASFAALLIWHRSSEFAPLRQSIIRSLRTWRRDVHRHRWPGFTVAHH
jgi:hypothetical protein